MAQKKKSLPFKKTKHLAKKTSKAKKSLQHKPDLLWKFSSRLNSLVKNPLIDDFSNDFCLRSKKLVRCADISDKELILVIKNQNKEVYKELFIRYRKKLLTYIFHLVGNREETEDVLQNVFSKTYKSIKKFDTSRSFSSWIYRIAHNEAVNFLKRKSKQHSVSWENVSTSKDKLDIATNDEPLEDKWSHQEINREIDEALKKLPNKYQQIIKLRYFQELSYEDISKILGKPVNTVGTLINRAKKKLLEVVKKQRIVK
jgi:RNA polymerase sigma-70 factor (ECF subfamily)